MGYLIWCHAMGEQHCAKYLDAAGEAPSQDIEGTVPVEYSVAEQTRGELCIVAEQGR
ncbi:hypothetical protein [Kribbella sp. NBC_00359]|uniref:hypothetical protein n=1 Tax=Kribbella sp. NBC_00359 TaxID=2975966 RepID=UPI002E1EDCBF